MSFANDNYEDDITIGMVLELAEISVAMSVRDQEPYRYLYRYVLRYHSKTVVKNLYENTFSR